MSLETQISELNETIKTLNETIKLLLQRDVISTPQATIPQCKKLNKRKKHFYPMKPKAK